MNPSSSVCFFCPLFLWIQTVYSSSESILSFTVERPGYSNHSSQPIPQTFFPTSFQKLLPGEWALLRGSLSFTFTIYRAFPLGVEDPDFVELDLIGVEDKDISLRS